MSAQLQTSFVNVRNEKLVILNVPVLTLPQVNRKEMKRRKRD